MLNDNMRKTRFGMAFDANTHSSGTERMFQKLLCSSRGMHFSKKTISKIIIIGNIKIKKKIFIGVENFDTRDKRFK